MPLVRDLSPARPAPPPAAPVVPVRLRPATPAPVRPTPPPAAPPRPSPDRPLPPAAILSEPGPVARLRGKTVRLRFIFGAEAHGTIVELSRYELVLRQADGSDLVVMKHAIQSLEETK